MNKIIAELLREQGIPVDFEEDEEVSVFDNYPYEIDGIWYYTQSQLDYFGEPNEDFYIIDEQEYGLSYQDELSLPKRRKPNLYNRFKRFKKIITEMTGEGNAPVKVIEDIAKYLNVNYSIENIFVPRKYERPISYSKFKIEHPLKYDEDIWITVRKYCRKRHSKHFNKIPSILRRLGVSKPHITKEQTKSIFDNFKTMEENFKYKKHDMGIKYFPNLRCTSLVLMKKHGIKFPYKVPLVCTKRKLKPLTLKINLLLNK